MTKTEVDALTGFDRKIDKVIDLVQKLAKTASVANAENERLNAGLDLALEQLAKALGERDQCKQLLDSSLETNAALARKLHEVDTERLDVVLELRDLKESCGSVCSDLQLDVAKSGVSSVDSLLFARRIRDALERK